MMDGRRVDYGQSQALKRLNERRVEVGMLPVLADAEVRALLEEESCCEEAPESRPRRIALRHYVKS